ncbi:MAG: alpha/beta fold hydrolase [Rhodospirillales bacterium]
MQRLLKHVLICLIAMPCLQPVASPAQTLATQEGDYVAHDFHFKSGETAQALRLHYTTLGKPERDAQGRVVNAVLILHGTGGTGHQFLSPQFANELFGPGQLLDPAKYFIILPDGIGHGKSSKPSDGLHARFPQYDYDDMVQAHYRLLAEGLGVNHLRLILGTSMGCMHAWVWGETYPGFMDTLMPLACQTVELAGRNRMWRKMLMDAIRNDPEWAGGEYKIQPKAAITVALDMLLLAGSAPLQMQKNQGTREAADKFVDDYIATRAAGLDANDLMYQVNASRNYNPSPDLSKIGARVMYINSGRRFHQSAGAGDRPTRNCQSEGRPLRAVAGDGPDARSRHPYLGCGVEGIPARTAHRARSLEGHAGAHAARRFGINLSAQFADVNVRRHSGGQVGVAGKCPHVPGGTDDQVGLRGRDRGMRAVRIGRDLQIAVEVTAEQLSQVRFDRTLPGHRKHYTLR